MASVFLSALFALTAPQAAVTAAPEPAPLDLRCYRLMAELAAEEDPRISAAGLTGAQYFLGRIDARSPGFDPDSAPKPAWDDSNREQLVGQCGALMGAGGRDFRNLGLSLIRPRDTI
jgi:hypothetical protein